MESPEERLRKALEIANKLDWKKKSFIQKVKAFFSRKKNEPDTVTHFTPTGGFLIIKKDESKKDE